MEFTIGYRYRNSVRWTVIFALFAGFLFVGFLWTRLSAAALTPAPHPYNSWDCQTGADASGTRTLHVFGMSRQPAGPLGQLCESGELAAHFDRVQLRWKTGDEESKDTFLGMKYDVLAVKPSRLKIGELGRLESYTEIARYAPYDAWLIARRETPRLDAAWFAGKRLGLGPALSVSGRDALQKALNDAGIKLNELDCKGFVSHGAMRAAFGRGDIDVFPSFWDEASDGARFPDARRLKIRDELEPVTWYLRSEQLGTPVHCAITGMLADLKSGSRDDYFRRLEVLRPCR